jgi:hypothetical protein
MPTGVDIDADNWAPPPVARKASTITSADTSAGQIDATSTDTASCATPPPPVLPRKGKPLIVADAATASTTASPTDSAEDRSENKVGTPDSPAIRPQRRPSHDTVKAKVARPITRPSRSRPSSPAMGSRPNSPGLVVGSGHPARSPAAEKKIQSFVSGKAPLARLGGIVWPEQTNASDAPVP